ncbi:MAG: hypothetical protein K2J70_05830 [Muribaculaceae bacterium]|nr:hypothetical protein [Muribaculaceae bacterium]
MKSSIVSLVTFLCFFITGCGRHHYMETLHHAECIVENYPDSARLIIDTINTEKLSSKERAHYTLLDVQTRHKLFMPLPESDSLITVSERYFSSHGPDSLHVKALFYRAVIATEAGKTEDAARDAIEAWEKAKELNNDYWQAKAAELVGDQAQEMHNYKEEVKWRKLAAESYKKVGKEINSIYAIIDTSSAFLNLHDSINSCNLIDSIGKVVRLYPKESDLQDYYNYYTLFVENAYGQPQKADSLYNIIKGTAMETINKGAADLVKADILISRGEYSKCRSLLDSLKVEAESDETFILANLYYRLGKNTSDLSMVILGADSLLSLQYRLLNSALEQPITASQRDFFQYLSSQREKQKRHKERVILWIILLSLVIIMLIIVIYRIHVHRKELVIKDRIAEIYSVSEEIKEMSKKKQRIEIELECVKKELDIEIKEIKEQCAAGELTIKNQRKELVRRANEISNINKALSMKNGLVNDIYTHQWEIINNLCSEFDDDDTYSKTKWANICHELSKLRSDTFYKEIERKTDLCTDGLITGLKSQCPGLKSDDIKLAVYLISGFSVASIHYMMRAKITTIYSRRKALIKKIEKAEPRDMEKFIAAIKRL